MTYCFAYIINANGKEPLWPGKSEARSKKDPPIRVRYNVANYLSPCQCYQELLETADEDIIIYMHSDIVIHDHTSTIVAEFEEDDDLIAVGLGGATQLGNLDLYRKPYMINNMARYGYCSNQDDAEVHGERFNGIKRVAVLDAFCMAVRTDWLRSRGGWPTQHLTHHCLDTWLACEAARDRKQIYMCGLSCVHHGGSMSCSGEYASAGWLQGGTTESDHALPHKWLMEEYRDVLPIKV